MRYLPMNYDTKGKNALILGGGLLALSRLKKLVDTEFKIYVIASSIVDEIKELSQKFPEKILLKETELSENFIFFSYDYVLIATNDFNLNQSFEQRCKNANILYERLDVISNSDLIMGEVIEKNNIKLGLDTNKLNPSLIDIIKEDIEKFLEGYSEEKFDILDDIRRELVRKNSSDIDKIIKDLYFNEKISLNGYLSDLKKDQIELETEDLDDFIENVDTNADDIKNKEETDEKENQK